MKKFDVWFVGNHANSKEIDSKRSLSWIFLKVKQLICRPWITYYYRRGCHWCERRGCRWTTFSLFHNTVKGSFFLWYPIYQHGCNYYFTYKWCSCERSNRMQGRIQARVGIVKKKTIPIIQILKFCWYVIFLVSYLCTLNTLMPSKFSGKMFRHLKVRFSIYMYHFSKKWISLF